MKENMKSPLFIKAKCAIYSLTITESQRIQMEQFLSEMEQKQKKYRYNLLGLIGILLHKGINRKHAYFCSEFVATTLKQGGILVKGKSVHLVRPFDFAECRDFKLVYQGPLQIYLSQVQLNQFPMAS